MNECTEVIRRWCELLISSKNFLDQQTAIKMYLSRRQFSRVLRSLNRLSDLKAFPFALICVASQLIDIDANRDVLEEIFDRFATRFFDYDSQLLAKLKSDIEENLLSNEGDSGQLVSEEANSETTLRQCWFLFTGKCVTIS